MLKGEIKPESGNSKGTYWTLIVLFNSAVGYYIYTRFAFDFWAGLSALLWYAAYLAVGIGLEYSHCYVSALGEAHGSKAASAFHYYRENRQTITLLAKFQHRFWWPLVLVAIGVGILRWRRAERKEWPDLIGDDGLEAKTT